MKAKQLPIGICFIPFGFCFFFLGVLIARFWYLNLPTRVPAYTSTISMFFKYSVQSLIKPLSRVTCVKMSSPKRRWAAEPQICGQSLTAEWIHLHVPGLHFDQVGGLNWSWNHQLHLPLCTRNIFIISLRFDGREDHSFRSSLVPENPWQFARVGEPCQPLAFTVKICVTLRCAAVFLNNNFRIVLDLKVFIGYYWLILASYFAVEFCTFAPGT